MKVRRFRIITLFADIVILASFLIMAATKPLVLRIYTHSWHLLRRTGGDLAYGIPDQR
jgi:hypothetical protein